MPAGACEIQWTALLQGYRVGEVAGTSTRVPVCKGVCSGLGTLLGPIAGAGVCSMQDSMAHMCWRPTSQLMPVVTQQWSCSNCRQLLFSGWSVRIGSVGVEQRWPEVIIGQLQDPPGAMMSGLMRPSVVGPYEEKAATLPYASADTLPAPLAPPPGAAAAMRSGYARATTPEAPGADRAARRGPPCAKLRVETGSGGAVAAVPSCLHET